LVAGAHINEKDTEGRTAIFLAAANNKLETCRILLENNADTNLTDSSGNTCKSFLHSKPKNHTLHVY
jgi:ankyrin repeat protein